MTQHHAAHGGAAGATIGGPAQHWRQEGIIAQFVEQTSAQAEERRGLFELARDLFPFEPDARIRVLDIGAGYGAFAAAVLDRFRKASAVGLDVSEPMMAVGRERMARFGDRFSYHAGDLANGELPADLPGPFDAAVASASIVHFPSETKQRLYAEMFRILNPGGCFVMVDFIAPANNEMQVWYQERYARERQLFGNQPTHPAVPHHHFEPEAHLLHHHLETEADQLAFLRAAGFVRVDCFYKRLLQAMIAGYKPSKADAHG